MSHDESNETLKEYYNTPTDIPPMFSGKDLIDLGYKPAPWFKDVIEVTNKLHFIDRSTMISFAKSRADILVEINRKKTLEFREVPIQPLINFTSESDLDKTNFDKCIEHMTEIGRLPNVVSTALMPDACPTDHVTGNIPVGGVVATKNSIFPSFHSADVCCSVAATFFDSYFNVKSILDVAQNITHFGPGDRKFKFPLPDYIKDMINNNLILTSKDLRLAEDHFVTQGDGNHFLYLGRSESGQYVLVTHHGSRGFGASLYNKGVALAKKNCKDFLDQIPAKNYWIDSESEDGKNYWDALQVVREWTKMNHYTLHDYILRACGGKITRRFWNEHNFVFKRDGLFYHAKGSTPSYNEFAEDSSGLFLIPLNMNEPILITKARDNLNALGFSPHGAGRNYSRRKLAETIEDKKAAIEDIHRQIDLRWYSGKADISELPLAYKPAQFIRDQIKKFDLCEIVEEIQPLGCIMNGH